MEIDLLNIVRYLFHRSTREICEVEDSKASRKMLLNLLDTLTSREVIVLIFRTSNRMTFKEVSKIMGVTPARVRQIEHKALRKMRHPSRYEKLAQFIADNNRIHADHQGPGGS